MERAEQPNQGQQMDADDPAMRMLLKMGYKPGFGLGKREEGITAPIQVEVRAKNTGIGFVEGVEKSKEPAVGDSPFVLKSKKKKREPREKPEPNRETGFNDASDREKRINDERKNRLQCELSRMHRMKARHKELRATLKLLEHQINEAKLQISDLDTSIEIMKSAVSMRSRVNTAVSLSALLPMIVKLSDFDLQLSLLKLYADQQSVCKLSVEDYQELTGTRKFTQNQLATVFILFVLNRIDTVNLSASDLFWIFGDWMVILSDQMVAFLLEEYISKKLDTLDHRLLLYTKRLSQNSTLFDKLKSLLALQFKELVKGREYKAAYDLYLKWISAFPEDLHIQVALSTIYPWLRRELSLIRIDPGNQDTRGLTVTVPFLKILPNVMAGHVFIESGLGKQLVHIMTTWLQSHDCDPHEVADFLEAWRGLIPIGISFKPIYKAVNQFLDSNC